MSSTVPKSGFHNGRHLFAAMLLAILLGNSAGPLWVGKFSGSGGIPQPWRVINYKNGKPTVYRQARIDGRPAIEARFDGSMAYLARPIVVDLAKTPVMCWYWWVEAPVSKGDLTTKSGDDYAARIYVMFDMPKSALDRATRLRLGMARRLSGQDLPDAALTYVWDNRHAVGTARKSAYTDRSQIIVAETGASRAGQWVAERANVAAHFRSAFAGKPGTPTRLAVAADGDNTRSRGRAAFADIHFVPASGPCSPGSASGRPH
ncbi:MAG TPA: DUF3047 domain-containing protein [Nitrospiraceae bacterium]|nr:DUF3047 domain-containing protein [Nitrospiraceae bacterium]